MGFETNRRADDWSCPDCGRVYALTYDRFPSRDRTNLYCDCGKTIIDENSTKDYSKKLKSEPTKKQPIEQG